LWKANIRIPITHSFWTITNTDPDAEASRLHFSRIELEDGVDYIIITDVDDKEFQRFTGVYTDGVWTDPIPGNDVKVRLVSDSNVNAWGFAADQMGTVAYTSLACSAHPYANNASMVWMLTNSDPSAEGSRVHFSRIEIEDGVDRILIMDPFDTIYQYITQTHTSGLWTVGVPGNDVKIRLESDSSVVDWGFNIDQIGSTSAASPAPAPSPGPALAQSDHPYPPGLDQTWTIINPNLNAISTKIHFDTIDVYNSGDRIYIRDNDGNLIQVIDYDATDLWTDYVPGRIVKVQFVDDGYGHGTQDWGFRVDVLVDGETQPVLAQSEHPYSVNLDQTWTIINPNLDAVSTKIHFDTIDVYNSGDRIYIRDNDGNLIQEINYDATDSWTDYVPGRIVKVQFVDDGYGHGTQDWGFRVDALVDGETQPVLAQSWHPYQDSLDQTWTIINPNLNAVSTKIHFDEIDLTCSQGCDWIYIRDNDGNLIQQISYDATDLWTDYVPGRIVKVQLVTTGSYTAWGFRIDDLAPRSESTPVPAYISGVYINVFAPAVIYLGDQEVLRTDRAGEFKIPLSGAGDYVIRIEYRTLDMEQQILVSMGVSPESGLSVTYLPLVAKDFP